MNHIPIFSEVKQSFLLLLLLEMFLFLPSSEPYVTVNDCCISSDVSDQSPKVRHFILFWLHFYAKFAWQMIIWMHPDGCRIA